MTRGQSRFAKSIVSHPSFNHLGDEQRRHVAKTIGTVELGEP